MFGSTNPLAATNCALQARELGQNTLFTCFAPTRWSGQLPHASLPQSSSHFSNPHERRQFTAPTSRSTSLLWTTRHLHMKTADDFPYAISACSPFLCAASSSGQTGTAGQATRQTSSLILAISPNRWITRSQTCQSFFLFAPSFQMGSTPMPSFDSAFALYSLNFLIEGVCGPFLQS